MINKHTTVVMISKHTAVAIYKRNGNILENSYHVYILLLLSRQAITKSLHHPNSFNSEPTPYHSVHTI